MHFVYVFNFDSDLVKAETLLDPAAQQGDRKTAMGLSSSARWQTRVRVAALHFARNDIWVYIALNRIERLTSHLILRSGFSMYMYGRIVFVNGEFVASVIRPSTRSVRNGLAPFSASG